MIDKYKPVIAGTGHTDYVGLEDAPEYMWPFHTIDDLSLDQFEFQSDNLNDIMNSFLDSGDASLTVNGHDLSGDLRAFYEFYQEQRDPPMKLTASSAEVEKAYAEYERHLLDNGVEITTETKSQFINAFIEQRYDKAQDGYIRSAIEDALINTFSDVGTRVGAMDGLGKHMTEAKFHAAAKEAFEFMNGVDREYLTRGATLCCTGGRIWRHLNLLTDHGIFYGAAQQPVINFLDSKAGDYHNITNFGHCSGTNPPPERIQLKSPNTATTEGAHTQEVSKKLARGPQCIPEILFPGWINPYEETMMAGCNAVTTKSFLICLHGGFIYPISSGQHDNILSAFDAEAAQQSFHKSVQQYKDMELAGALINMIKAVTPEERKSKQKQMDQNNTDKEDMRTRMEKKLENYMKKIFGGAYDSIPQEYLDILREMQRAYDEMFGTNYSTTPLIDQYNEYHAPYGYNSQASGKYDFYPLADGQTVDEVQAGLDEFYEVYCNLIAAGNQINEMDSGYGVGSYEEVGKAAQIGADKTKTKEQLKEENQVAKDYIQEQMEHYIESYRIKLERQSGTAEEWALLDQMEEFYAGVFKN